jgi:flagellar protein FliS
MNGYARAQNAYTESSVLTAPPEQLVLMLYDGALRFLRQSAAAMREGERSYARERMRRAEAIVDELNVTLDMSQGEVATRLRAIYLFCKRHLMQSLVDTDPKGIDAVIELLTGLRESWSELAARSTAA